MSETSATAAAPSARLLLLDGHSLAYRAFFALPVENFSTATGQHTNAVYGFTSMLVNVLRDEVPTHVAVAFDKSRQTFRLQEYPEYKAKRNKTPGEFSSQLPLIQQVLDSLRIRHLDKDGYEADDIIATLVTQALAEGMEVLILTGDRDSIQLVTESSTVLYPMRGVSELARMTPELWLVGIGMAVLLPVVPFTLEMLALRRLTTAAFGTLMSLEPAFALLVGLTLLGQVPDLLAVLGIGFVVAAGVGAERGGARAQPEPLAVG